MYIKKIKVKILAALICGSLAGFGMTESVRADDTAYNQEVIATETDAKPDDGIIKDAMEIVNP